MADAQQDPRNGDNIYIGFMAIQGRDGSNNSFLISERQCLEAYNVDWFLSGLGQKRGGARSITNGFKAVAMFRHVPSDDQTAAEFWAMDETGVLHRYSGGAWSTPTMMDACTASPQEAVFCSFNGKLYIAYKSAHNRLHVWDPTVAQVRRVGFDLPATLAAPVLAAGAIVADTRKYRVAWTRQEGGVTIRRSNLGVASAAVVYVNQQGTFARPAVPNETETHWELWGASTSSVFGDYRLVATSTIATLTAVDNGNTLPAQVSPNDGANTPPPSAKYLVCDSGRVIMGGCWEVAANAENAMAPKTNRLWWTSILGASNIGDDERISNTGTINSYADLSESVTGISYPMQIVQASANSLERGSFYVFGYSTQTKFISTGNTGDSGPYLQFLIAGGQGCIHHKSICLAQNANGSPSIMWAATSGIFRITTNGQEFCGEDNIDLWDDVNLDATIPCHMMFYPDRHQVWVYFASGTSSYPDRRLVFDTQLGRITSDSGVRQGWALHEGESTKAYCSCLFSRTLGASVSRRLVPHIGYSGSAVTQEIWQCNTSDLTDGGVAFQGYLDSRSYAPWGLGRKGGFIEDAILVADTGAGVQVHMTVYRSEGVETETFHADLSAHSDSEAETLVFPKFDGSHLADSFSFRCRVGDLTATEATWNLHGVVVPTTYQGQ